MERRTVINRTAIKNSHHNFAVGVLFDNLLAQIPVSLYRNTTLYSLYIHIFLPKKVRHIIKENSKMMCLIVFYRLHHCCRGHSRMTRGRFVNRPNKVKSIFRCLLRCLFDSNCARNGHTNHGVVTCADKSHHLHA